MRTVEIEIVTLSYSPDVTTGYLTVYNGITREVEWDLEVPILSSDLTMMSEDVDTDGVNEIIIVYNEFIRGSSRSVSTTDRVEIIDVQTKALEWEFDNGTLFDFNQLLVVDVDSDGINEFIINYINAENIYEQFLEIYNGQTRALEWMAQGYISRYKYIRC